MRIQSDNSHVQIMFEAVARGDAAITKPQRLCTRPWCTVLRCQPHFGVMHKLRHKLVGAYVRETRQTDSSAEGWKTNLPKDDYLLCRMISDN